LVLFLAPLAPHIAEELWSRLGHTDGVTFQPFPTADPAYLVDDEITVPVSINGKPRSQITVSPDAPQEELEAMARADEKIVALIAGQEVVKVIVVPGKMVNLVVR